MFEPEPGRANLREDFNLYTGAAVDVGKLAQCNADNMANHIRAVKPVLQHIYEVWCDSRPELYQYVIQWMAHVVQKPWAKTRVGIVLQSKQGAGKGLIVDKFGEIFGPHYKSMDLEDATGRFNASLADTLVLFLDETTWGGNREGRGKLYKVVTQPFHQVEEKFKDRFQVANHINVLVASNGDWVVPCDDATRRWFMLQVNNKYAGIPTTQTAQYFETVANVPVESLAFFLYHCVDIHDFKPWVNVPQTAMLTEHIERGYSIYRKFWAFCLREGCITDGKGDSCGEWQGQQPLLVDKGRVYAIFEAFARGNAAHCDAGQFWKELKQLVKMDDSRTGGKRQVTLPSLSDCQQQWTAVVGLPLVGK